MTADVSALVDIVLPIAALDGAHSRHHFFKGVYLTLTLLTSDAQSIVIAWAIVKTESEATWRYFLSFVKRAGLGVFLRRGVVVFSDRDKGLGAATSTSEQDTNLEFKIVFNSKKKTFTKKTLLSTICHRFCHLRREVRARLLHALAHLDAAKTLKRPTLGVRL